MVKTPIAKLDDRTVIYKALRDEINRLLMYPDELNLLRSVFYESTHTADQDYVRFHQYHTAYVDDKVRLDGLIRFIASLLYIEHATTASVEILKAMIERNSDVRSCQFIKVSIIFGCRKELP